MTHEFLISYPLGKSTQRETERGILFLPHPQLLNTQKCYSLAAMVSCNNNLCVKKWKRGNNR